MLKRFSLFLAVIALLVGGVAPAVAQSGNSLTVLAPTSVQPVVEAWAAAFGEAHTDVSLNVEFVESSEEILSRAANASVILTDDPAAAPELDFECGFISDVYVPLPGVGAWVIASNSCGGSVDPIDAAALDFAAFIVSADGQQVAIDQGALPESVEIVDQAGMTVTIPQPVRRIASPYSMATFYVYGVGAGDRLVVAGYLGVNSDATKDVMRAIDPNFDALSTAVSTLSQKEANIEELAALEPDLLLASARTDWLDAADELGLAIIRFDGESPEKLKEAMSLLGAVLGPNAAYRADEFNAYYDETLANILAQTEGIENPVRVYFSGTDALRAASADMYQTMMIEAAGGVSVSSDLAGYWNDVNLEQIAVWNPDVIFFPPYGGASADAFAAPEWASIKAVQDGKVYGVPKLVAPWDTPVPDSILGIIWMAETLYPDQVDLDCPVEATNFYSRFYGYTVTESDLQSMCP
ncbi:MAG TPA: ABC transporter substrate-binding protein [Aggregatilinea sp.]|uniref:ABC transporter substrate-binding protein n=1 Tax=Aggregatilinea sp. TaxID=2806333 RepID=UPI002CE20446|nr:ABC transporter substrate-binding protein [Aggregatilinea sp.]HML21952.1 ABC transporter substrate-binding protein [Aggregatilinea sp.]